MKSAAEELGECRKPGEAVALITSAEHYGAVLNVDFDYPRYLDTLRIVRE